MVILKSVYVYHNDLQSNVSQRYISYGSHDIPSLDIYKSEI